MVLARRPPSKIHTFGLHRAEIVGALLSISMVWLVTGWLVAEAIQRIRDPKPIDGRIMMFVAGLGIIANIAMGLALHDPRPRQILSVTESGEAQLLPAYHHDHHHHHHENMNVRAALLHVLGDLAQSVGVFLASLLIAFYPSGVMVDPLCTLLSSCLVIGSTSYLAKDILNVIMEAVPSHIDLDELAEAIHACSPDIIHVHDLHIWALAPGKTLIIFKLQITSHGNTVSVLKACKQMLTAKHGIHHSTIQLEKDER
jgi:cation diffusion facilitator family transporter